MNAQQAPRSFPEDPFRSLVQHLEISFRDFDYEQEYEDPDPPLDAFDAVSPDLSAKELVPFFIFYVAGLLKRDAEALLATSGKADALAYGIVVKKVPNLISHCLPEESLCVEPDDFLNAWMPGMTVGLAEFLCSAKSEDARLREKLERQAPFEKALGWAVEGLDHPATKQAHRRATSRLQFSSWLKSGPSGDWERAISMAWEKHTRSGAAFNDDPWKRRHPFQFVLRNRTNREAFCSAMGEAIETDLQLEIVGKASIAWPAIHREPPLGPRGPGIARTYSGPSGLTSSTALADRSSQPETTSIDAKPAEHAVPDSIQASAADGAEAEIAPIRQKLDREFVKNKLKEQGMSLKTAAECLKTSSRTLYKEIDNLTNRRPGKRSRRIVELMGVNPKLFGLDPDIVTPNS